MGKRKTPPTLGEQLKARREELGWTFYRVAKEAGIPNPHTIQTLEAGGRDARLSNVLAVIEALGLKIELVEE